MQSGVLAQIVLTFAELILEIICLPSPDELFIRPLFPVLLLFELLCTSGSKVIELSENCEPMLIRNGSKEMAIAGRARSDWYFLTPVK
jgi:hypothetical protein